MNLYFYFASYYYLLLFVELLPSQNKCNSPSIFNLKTCICKESFECFFYNKYQMSNREVESGCARVPTM